MNTHFFLKLRRSPKAATTKKDEMAINSITKCLERFSGGGTRVQEKFKKTNNQHSVVYLSKRDQLSWESKACVRLTSRVKLDR